MNVLRGSRWAVKGKPLNSGALHSETPRVPRAIACVMRAPRCGVILPGSGQDTGDAAPPLQVTDVAGTN
jgi:hypothetical protein